MAAVRAALKSSRSEDLNLTLPAIEEAIAGVREVQAAIASGSARESELHAELEHLQRDLRNVSRLVDHGAGIQAALARILGSVLGGYTESGEAAPIKASGDVSISG